MLVVFEALHQRVDVLRHRRLGVSIRRRGRLTEAAQVRRDHGMFVREFCDQRQPHMAGFGVAVQQHDGVALAGDQIMQLDAIDLGEFALRRLRERFARIEQCNGQRHQRDGGGGTKSSDRELHPVFPLN